LFQTYNNWSVYSRRRRNILALVGMQAALGCHRGYGENGAKAYMRRALCTHGPVPLRLIVCGLVGSFVTFTAMLALSVEPPPVGVNFTAIVHDEFAAAIAPQVPPATVKSVEFAPLKLSLNGSANPDKFVTVAFKVFDVVFSVPKAIETGVTVAGIVGPVLIATG